MLDTALLLLRYGLSLSFNRPLRIADLHHLVADMVATQREFGTLGEEGAGPMQGAVVPDDTRRVINEQRLRRVARLAYDETPYYRDLFDRVGLKPRALSLDRLGDLPITPKSALKAMPEAFVRRHGAPSFEAYTTGTTGHPTSVWFSRYELELGTALAAIAFLANRIIAPDDVVQVNISSRAALGTFNTVLACRLLGAAAYPVGLVDPEETLSRLARPVHLPGKKPQVSVMTTYPTYLAALVEAGERLGYGPGDFGLERILCGSEILTAALSRRAGALFGARVVDDYAMTEIFPVAGIVCSEGHLHMTPEQGLVEVLRPADHQPAGPGEVGTFVVTPFYPYRECSPVLRLDTADVVRRLPEGKLQCEFAQFPATSPILGKMELSIEAGGRRWFQRDIQEVLEADASVTLPTRYALHPTGDGFDLHVLVRDSTARVVRRLEQGAMDAGLPLRRLRLYDTLDDMPPTLPVRADLREQTFTRARAEPARSLA